MLILLPASTGKERDGPAVKCGYCFGIVYRDRQAVAIVGAELGADCVGTTSGGQQLVHWCNARLHERVPHPVG